MFNYSNLSDTGRVRQTNEDFTWSGKNSYDNLAGIVCDGLGGYKGGSAASEITVNVFVEKFKKTDLSTYTSEQINEWINTIIDEARQKISYHIIENPKLANMATTFVCAIIVDNKAYIYNVGDSRAWLISKHHESRLVTIDQNLYNYLKKINAPNELFMEHRDNLYAITQFVGAKNNKKIKPDNFLVNLEKGDFIVLTSDGCHNFCTLNEMIDVIIEEDDLNFACSQIISKSLANNSNDNLSIVILGV